MKITAIRATPVNLPLETPFAWALGWYPGTSKVIVEVETDDGITGLGECTSVDCAPIINDCMARELAGLDPLDLAACEERVVPEARTLSLTEGNVDVKSFGGIEMALWDLKGKAFGLPLYKLLGGAVRKEIAFAEYFGYRLKTGKVGGEQTPAKVAAYCARMREQHGSTCFEGKCSSDDPVEVVQIIKEVRAALGADAIIRLDANMAWSLTTARKLLADLAPYNLRNFEDPVATFYEMQKLRQHSAIPFSSHFPDLKLAFQLGVPDTIVMNLTVLGGIARTLKFIAACEEMGVGFWFYSGESGIGSAAYLHVGAATRHVHEPSQSLFRYLTDDVIEEGPFKPVNNLLRVPEGPGLGVTLSKTGFKRCHERFLKDGPYDSYYTTRKPRRFVRLPVN